MPVDILAAVEWKKLMWGLFRSEALTLFLVVAAAAVVVIVVVVAVAVVKVICLARKNLEVGIKDARMSEIYICE